MHLLKPLLDTIVLHSVLYELLAADEALEIWRVRRK
jgi:hypothetical protein